MCVFVCEREEEGEYSSGCVKIQSGDDDDDDDDNDEQQRTTTRNVTRTSWRAFARETPGTP